MSAKYGLVVIGNPVALSKVRAAELCGSDGQNALWFHLLSHFKTLGVLVEVRGHRARSSLTAQGPLSNLLPCS